MYPCGMKPQWHLEHQKTMLHPEDSPPVAPTCLLWVQGNARDGGAAGWVAGGFKHLLGDTGHYRTERGP